MRTNIDIDDATLEAAMRAGPFKTKKDAVEAGLKLLARQAAYREILKWQGKLKWEGNDGEGNDEGPVPVTTGKPAARRSPAVGQPTVAYNAKKPRDGRR